MNHQGIQPLERLVAGDEWRWANVETSPWLPVPHEVVGTRAELFTRRANIQLRRTIERTTGPMGVSASRTVTTTAQ